MKTIFNANVSVTLLFIFLSLVILSETGLAASQLSQFGITWKFDKDYQTGQFANGDWWVVGPVKIIEINPRSVESGGRTMNGSMLNPMASNDNLGYDSELKGYKPELNVALNVSSSNPLVLQPNSSLVSTISVTAAAAKPQIDSAAVLTVLGAPAPAGSFRPPYCGTDKTIKYNKSQLSYDLLQSLKRVPDTPRLRQAIGDSQSDSVERMFERPWIDHRRGWYARWIHPKQNMPDYQREMSTQIGEAALMLLVDFTKTEKETLLIRYCQLGIDLFGIVENGGWRNWEPDGGTASGRKWPILFTGMVLGDAAMADIGSHAIDDPYFGEDAQTFYVTQEDIDRIHTDGFADGTPQPSHDYSQENLGMPEWGIRHATNPYMDNVSWGASYRQCCTANAWGGFIMAAHIMGVKGLWQHDALFDYQDRYMSIETPGTFNRQQSRFAEQMWDTYRASYGPIWPATSSNQTPRANAGADQTVTDTDGNGTAQVTLNGSASSDPDGLIVSYVWTENGTQIATGASPTVILATGQHSITLQVTDDEGAKNIDSVVITVESAAPVDTTPPAITSVAATQNAVTVKYNETLDKTSAETAANYTINNVSITSAALDADGMTVTLNVSALAENTAYSLTVTNVRDIAGNAIPESVESFFYDGGVVSHWSFNDGSGTIAQDSTEVANTGALVNGPVWVTGKLNGGIAFDGYDDAVEVTTSNFSANSGTVAMWVYPQAFPNGKNFLFGHATQPWANRIQLYCDDQGWLSLGLGDNSGLRRNIQNLALNRWYHIALLWNNSVYTVYVDGVPAAIGSYSGLTQIGQYADIANNGNPASRVEAFDGILDDVYVYDRPLTNTEIAALINQQPEFLMSPIGNKQVDENSVLTFTIDTPQPGVTVDLFEDNLPGTPSVTNNTFNWTSTYECSGVYDCTFRATDGVYEDFETISITVNNVDRAPVLDAIADVTVTEGQAVSFAVTAADPDGDTLSYGAVNLPSGATLSNGTFIWTPASGQAGSYNVMFTASDGNLQDSETVSITVEAASGTTQPSMPIFYSYLADRSNPKDLSGQTVSNDICVFLVPNTTLSQVLFYLDDPDMSSSAIQVENSAPYDFAGGSVSQANAYDTTQLPDGWHNISVAAILPDGNLEIGSVDFFVDNGQVSVNNPPMLDFIPEQTIEEGVELSVAVDAVDPDGDPIAYSAANLPAGSDFRNQTFTWIPEFGQAGIYQVTFTADDGALTDSQTITITVTAPPAEDTSGLVGYWNLDEAAGSLAADSSSACNDGTLANGPVWTIGRTGAAVGFDGNDDAIEVSTDGWQAESGTIALWAYPRDFYNGKHFLFGHATQPWANRIQLYTDKRGSLYLGLGDTSKREQRIADLPVNMWTSVALTWNKGLYTVYVNGSPVASGTYSGLSAINSYCDIGNNGNRDTRSEAFDGIIDDVRVYNRDLSEAEIVSLLSQ